MKKLILLSIILSTVLFAKEITREFSKVEELEVKLVLGSCEFQKSPDDKIHVQLEYTYDDDVFKAEFYQKKDKLEVEEKFERNTNGDGESHWKFSIPDEMEVEFNSATGNLYINGINAEFEGSTGTGNLTLEKAKGEIKLDTGTGKVVASECFGEFEFSSGTGSVKINNCQGEFEASSGTGSVVGENLTIEDSGEFSSGTGKVEIKGINGEAFDLELSSGTSHAELDLNGEKIEGEYVMSALKRVGKIDSPFKFDREEEIDDGNSVRVRKSFTLGKDQNSISISSGTGKAILKK